MAFKSGSFATFLIVCRKSHRITNFPGSQRQRGHETVIKLTQSHPTSNLFLPGHYLLPLPLRLPDPVVDSDNPRRAL